MTAIEVSNSSSLGPHPRFPSSVKPGIPKLPEPKSGWSTLTIGKLFDVVERPVTMRDDEHYRLVTVKRSRGGVVEREILPGRKISVKTQFYVKPGDFLISKRQIVHGACGFVPEELDGAIVSNEYSVLRCKPIIDPIFLLYLSFTPYFQQTCFHSSIGVHVEKMIFKLSDWFKWKIRLPSYEEQQEIASFLSSVDSKITKLRRKRELLEIYKRGMMQKLFSQELHFKSDDGSEFPGWRKKEFGLLVELKKDVVKPESMNSAVQSIELDSIQSNTGKILSVYPAHQLKSLKYKFEQTHVLFGKLRPYLRKFCFPRTEGVCSTEIWVLEARKLVPDYLFYYVQSSYFGKVVCIQAGSKMPRADWLLTSNHITAYPSVEEQQRIADCLSAIDQKIDAVAQQIVQMETFKQGLLQKMFV